MSFDTSQISALDRHRSYLLLLARWHWNPRLQARLDPSDIVQQTLVAAWQARDDFRGQTEAELRAWLRTILTRLLADWARNLGRQKRDALREQALDGAVQESSVRLEAWLDDRQSSPEERAERNEQLAQLAEAIATLPEAQQEAVTMHHLHGLSMADIGEHMGRSSMAVAGLLKRGLHALRTTLERGA